MGAGYSFGEYDVTVLYEASDDTAAASIALAVAAGGGLRAARTTKLLSGQEWIASLQAAQKVAPSVPPGSLKQLVQTRWRHRRLIDNHAIRL